MTKQEAKKNTYDIWDLFVKFSMVAGGIALTQCKWGLSVRFHSTTLTVGMVLGTILVLAVALEYMKLRTNN